MESKIPIGFNLKTVGMEDLSHAQMADFERPLRGLKLETAGNRKSRIKQIGVDRGPCDSIGVGTADHDMSRLVNVSHYASGANPV